MKKRFMKLITSILALSIIMGSLSTSAAVENGSLSPKEGSIPDITHTEYVIIQNGIVTNTDANSSETRSGASDITSLSITMETYDLPECTEYHISCPDIQSVSEDDRLVIAEYILENYLDYTPDQISTMSIDQRLKIGYGKLIISQKLKPKISLLVDSEDELVKGNMTYRLNFTSTSNSSGTIAITAHGSGNVEITSNVFLSICAQNVACVTDSSNVNGSYYLETRHTFYHTEDDSNYDSIISSSGTGIKYNLDIPQSTSYLNVKDLFVVGTVDVNNSSVQPGGSFNVYGNFGFVTTYIGGSVSYPWGFTPSLESFVKNNKTQLTAKF